MLAFQIGKSTRRILAVVMFPLVSTSRQFPSRMARIMGSAAFSAERSRRGLKMTDLGVPEEVFFFGTV